MNSGPDRDDTTYQDDVGVPRTLEHLEAEVRRLRAELLRCQDVLGDALDTESWPKLLASARRAWEVAEKALRRPHRR